MRYDRIYKAKFIERPNRFIAYAELNGKKETVHVKNTGRCAELLRPGADIYIQESDNPSRKTRWDLIAVKKGSRMINMDSQIPNKVVKEWIEQGNLFGNVTLIRPETVYKNSQRVLILLTSFKRSTIMPHIDIKCFPRELDEQQKAALAADITDVIIRHLNSKDSSISIALQQIQPESWQAIWDAEIAPQMETLIKKPGYSM